MNYSKLLYLLITVFILSCETNAAEAAAVELMVRFEVGPVRMRHVNEEGIQGVYTVSKFTSTEDLLEQFLEIPGISRKATYKIIYPTPGSPEDFKAFVAFAKTATEPPTIYVLQHDPKV
jgi:hypothetical protein